MPKKIPLHIAIIMDGNATWAKKNKLPKIKGYEKGIERLKETVSESLKSGIKILTVYAFSTENWKRPSYEINNLFKLMERFLDKESNFFIKQGIKINIIGTLDRFPEKLKEKIINLVRTTEGFDKLVLNIALGYGGRAEIVRAAKNIARDVEAQKLNLNNLNENIFSGYLYTAGLRDPDLLIRTSGKLRLSNFLLWQISYTELYFASKTWPDFSKKDFAKAITEYKKRDRKFGQ